MLQQSQYSFRSKTRCELQNLLPQKRSILEALIFYYSEQYVTMTDHQILSICKFIDINKVLQILLSTYRESSIDMNLFFFTGIWSGYRIFCTVIGRTSIAGLIDQHSFHAFVGKPEFKRAWCARNDDNLCARSSLYACRGWGRRRTARAEWNKKREREKTRDERE